MSDRALKERIIGAVVLVVFAVLVVPIFLDGPPDEQETISEAVTLPGQNSQDKKQQKIVLNRDRSEPVPATRAPAQADTRPEPGMQQRRAASASAVDETEPPAATAQQAIARQSEAISETGMWVVQLGSFSNQDNAERLAASLRNQGYGAFLSQLQTASDTLHRVRVGPQKDRESAEAIAVQLGKTGHKGQVVPHP